MKSSNDESTDIAILASFSAFVRFEFNEIIQEELLFCNLPSTTTGEDFFICLDSFIKENKIDWTYWLPMVPALSLTYTKV